MDAKSAAPLALLILVLESCAGVGSIMSPYSERFACKNDDHGQCVHPDRAYEDAVAGVVSRSDPAVTRQGAKARGRKGAGQPGGAYEPYRESVYRELQGLVEEPVTPMLRPPRTVRTLILPYGTSDRPERLYMARYVYSVMDRPVWTLGQYLVKAASDGGNAPGLGQVRDRTAVAERDATADRDLRP